MAEYKTGSTGDGVDSEASRASETFKYVPKPPAPGQMMKCRDCGCDMPPESFPNNKTLRKLLFKWQLCHSCWLKVSDFLDRSTPGLMADRGEK